MGVTKANAQVAGFLFNAAKNGHVTAQIFWLKTRARWKETPHELVHSGRVRDVKELTDEELTRMVAHFSDKIAIEEAEAETSTLEPVAPESSPHDATTLLPGNGHATTTYRRA